MQTFVRVSLSTKKVDERAFVHTTVRFFSGVACLFFGIFFFLIQYNYTIVFLHSRKTKKFTKKLKIYKKLFTIFFIYGTIITVIEVITRKEREKMKKRRLKKWVLYLLFIIALLVFFGVCDRLGLANVVYSIEEHGNGLDITKIILILGAWEILKATIKAIFKREKEEE